MSLDYLEDLSAQIDRGKVYYACPGVQAGEWHLAGAVDDLKNFAQRAANSRKMEVPIYRVVNMMDTVTGDSYLLVRKILDPGPRGEPRIQWSVVDTREAAEMLRDVSQGPTPYFGATVEQMVKPTV
jgi:hypothetical protein